EDDAGRRIVVKIVHASADAVDGHDLVSFLRKPRQIARVHRDLPGLSPYYVNVVGEWQGPGWAAYAMPYVQEASPCAYLTGESPDEESFFGAVHHAFDVLGSLGYPAGVAPAPADHFRRAHIDRVVRRLPLLSRHVDPCLTGSDRVRVNGRPVPTIGPLLRRLAALPGTLVPLRPARLHYPVHGDLNLGNLLFRMRAVPAGEA